jgi:hypothetical protein
MKELKLAAMATLLTVLAAQAQTSQTNVVQNLSIQLSGVEQVTPVAVPQIVPGSVHTNGGPILLLPSAAAVRVDTRQVIQALGLATSNTFSSTGRLVVVTPLGGGVSSIQVRDGSNTVDVTGFFLHQQLSNVVSNSFPKWKFGNVTETEFSIQEFALQDSSGHPALGLHFNISGFATETTGNICHVQLLPILPPTHAGKSCLGTGASSNIGNGVQHSDLNINGSGTGDRNGSLLILQGFINVFGNTLEVVATGGGGST